MEAIEFLLGIIGFLITSLIAVLIYTWKTRTDKIDKLYGALMEEVTKVNTLVIRHDVIIETHDEKLTKHDQRITKLEDQ